MKGNRNFRCAMNMSYGKSEQMGNRNADDKKEIANTVFKEFNRELQKPFCRQKFFWKFKKKILVFTWHNLDMIFEDFFSFEKPKNQEDINMIMTGYNNAAITHSIIIDYLEEMHNDIKTLAEIIDMLPN